MSFGENVTYYRKKLKITQENLAEWMSVSRQTVSRWETDSTFPDVDTLIKLCDLFKCDLDTLVRGSAADETRYDEAEPDLRATDCRISPDTMLHDRHMKRFALGISGGVMLVLFGVVALLLVMAIASNEVIGAVTLLSFITLAVALFVASGVNHGLYLKENRVPIYSEEKRRAFLKKCPYAFAIATALILVGVITMILMLYSVPSAIVSTESWQMICVAVFLIIISIAVFMYIFTGITMSKFDAPGNNSHIDPDSNLSPRGKRISDALCSATMLSATAIFLALGFTQNLWHPAWVAFPIGGILCGIISSVLEAIFPNNR